MNKQKNKNAFTLVELIIVITILAILATIAFISFQWYTKNARDSNRTTTLSNLQKWLDVYEVQSLKLPEPDWTILSWSINNITLTKVWIIWDNISRLVKISKTPIDPLWWNNYAYWVSADNRYYQIWITLENLESYNFTKSSYADNGNIKAKVIWNYRYPLKLWNKLYSLPSLLFTWNWWDLLDENNVKFVINNWQNLPYSPSGNLNNSQTTTQVLQSITWTWWLTLTWVDISWINVNDIKNWVWETNNLLATFWITDKDILWKSIFWNEYSTNTNTNSVPAYVSWIPYTKWQSFTFDWNIWYVSKNTKVAYTRSSWNDEFPQDLTSSDLILVFENWDALTKWTNAFILKTVNQWATQPYIYGKAYTSGRLWNEWDPTNYWWTDSNTLQASYTADKSILWDYYQWWRNNPVSLTWTTTNLYNTTWYLTWWVNLSTDYWFIINSSNPNSWMDTTQHNTSSWVIWTNANNSWPCNSWFRLPTTSTTIWNWEWRKVVEIVTWKTASWSNIEATTLQKYLLMPMAGFRMYSSWYFNNQGFYGWYWSSTVNGFSIRNLLFGISTINPSVNGNRSNGFMIRCFKN